MPSLLENIQSPQDLKSLSPEELTVLAQGLRQEIIRIVSQTGGHLGANLGVVELTVALHHIFNTPEDKLIWDVGHQAYGHKILTGRHEAMKKVRLEGGASGFTKRSESVFDPFGAAHAGTSISAALGFAVARDLQKNHNHVIAVIGDGSMSCGMAYEALNNAGHLKSRLIVILNDNDMSIAPPVGAMSAYLSRLLSSHSYLTLRQAAKGMASYLPKSFEKTMQRAEEYARGLLSGGGTLFEELGFYYVGPIDGHSFDHLIPVLKNLRDGEDTSPVLLHVVTQKGKGYLPAEQAQDKYHGVNKFDIPTGNLVKSSSQSPTYTQVFAQSLIEEAHKDPKILAITAAMPSGTGLDLFQKEFPDRCFDVGISEQHAVTFAAGLACEGFKPFVAIYSTFLQRAYDQIIHDVVLQKLPVRFAIDRAGLVGADGATHAGSYDIAFLGCLPDMVLMAPSDLQELKHMIATTCAIEDQPCAFRYPRGEGSGINLVRGHILPLGKGRILQEGRDVAILSYGARLSSALEVAQLLKEKGLSVTVADARFAKPLDEDLSLQLAKHHKLLVTFEEGSMGGFSSLVFHFLALQNALPKSFLPITLPDFLIDHAAPERQLEMACLDAGNIVKRILQGL